VTRFHEFLDLAIVETTCGYTANVKINDADDRLEVNDFIIIPFFNHPTKRRSIKKSEDLKSFKIFKSGQTSDGNYQRARGCHVAKNRVSAYDKYEHQTDNKEFEANPHQYHHKSHFIFIIGIFFVIMETRAVRWLQLNKTLTSPSSLGWWSVVGCY
jgi:hypothetical protein